MSSPLAIDVADLSKKYGERMALSHANFEVPMGSICGFVGPNGSGKTSILDAIHVVVKVFENPQNPELREGLEYNVQQLVRCRGNIAQIAFEYSIEKDEAEAINDVYSSLGLKQNFNLSKSVAPLESPEILPSNKKLKLMKRIIKMILI